MRLPFNELSHETEKAYLFKISDEQSFWVPKAVIDHIGNDYVEIDDEMDFEPTYFKNTYKDKSKPKSTPTVSNMQVHNGVVYVQGSDGMIYYFDKDSVVWIRLPSLAISRDFDPFEIANASGFAPTDDDIPF